MEIEIMTGSQVETHLSQIEEEDLYRRMKALEKELEFLDIHETYIKEEMNNLKRELVR
jgi:26S proteasome regulatory subunit T3